MSSAPSPSRPVSRWNLLVIILLLGAAASFALWRWQRPARKPAPDMVAAMQANNVGIGHMDRFEYTEAIQDFETVVDKAPDWAPGKINLGIALLNGAGKIQDSKQMEEKNRLFGRAIALFNQVLEEEPENSQARPFAHYCLGIIYKTLDKSQQALPHFEAVTHIDPKDAIAWYQVGALLTNAFEYERAAECFLRALQLDPHLTAAIYGIAQNPFIMEHDPARRAAALAEFQALGSDDFDGKTQGNVLGDKYTEMGRYAEVIGRQMKGPPPATGPLPLFLPHPHFQVKLAPQARWATTADFGKGPVAELRAAVRSRFGAVMVMLDYNRDGKPDLFLLSAVAENGKVRDLLLRNDGNGVFTDVTTEAGLAEARPSLGCCVADFDNDGYPDLLITGAGEQRLFRNTGKGRFEDVTVKSELDRLHSVCLGAIFIDLDQDGDLDLIVAQYAATPETALARLQGKESPADGGLAVFLNIGEAPPITPAQTGLEPLLNCRFRRAFQEAVGLPTALVPPPALGAVAAAETMSRFRLLGGAAPTVGIVAADFDLDRDLDLLVLADQAPASMVVNDRLFRFHRADLPKTLVPLRPWNGGLVLDVDHDGRSDLVLIGPGAGPLLLLNRSTPGQADPGKWWEVGAIKSPPLLQAQAIDLDLDGWIDVVGLSEQRKPVLLHNDGQNRLVHREGALGSDADWPADLMAVTVADFDGDHFPGLLVWSEKSGLQLRKNQGNGNHALVLELTGRRGTEPAGVKIRTNAEGFGVWASAHAGELWTGAEFTTLSAGLGQSRQCLMLGLAGHTQADVIRLRWPDGVWQAELHQPTGQCLRLAEFNRKDISCPILFTWNGQQFVFVTDFLGAGSMGEPLPGGGHRPPRPEESVKIEAEQLVPLDGHYVLKFAEPMDEVTYLDRLQLVVLDHPADVRVYPDERFPSDRPATQELLAVRQEIFPVKARDHRGRDVTRTLAKWDRDTVDGFAHRSWLGFAEEHWVELDFGERLAKFSPNDRLILYLAGWTDYPYPESIWAATQAGVALQSPTLERLGEDGRWHTLIADAGFPAGLPRMMSLEVTGKLGGPRCKVRLRTNMEVYWDQIFVAPLLEVVATKDPKPSQQVWTTCLEVSQATLSARGCMQEFSPDGKQPTIYDYDRLEAVPVSRLAGRLTRLGDVTELLRDLDDRFVLFGPGDEVTVRFDASKLPELPSGWKRSFVLRTWGYCKDCSPFSDGGETVEPLPFRGMSNYPYGPDEHYPRDPLHQEYSRRYNTRQVGPGKRLR